MSQLKAVLHEVVELWRITPRPDRLQVRLTAVLAGWLIQFVIGGTALFFAGQFYQLRNFFELINGVSIPPITPAMLAWWQYHSLMWLFFVWGAFRCARMAGSRLFGSQLLYWLGIEVFAMVFWLDSGVSESWLLNLLCTGVLTFIGTMLALHYAMQKRATVAEGSVG